MAYRDIDPIFLLDLHNERLLFEILNTKYARTGFPMNTLVLYLFTDFTEFSPLLPPISTYFVAIYINLFVKQIPEKANNLSNGNIKPSDIIEALKT